MVRKNSEIDLINKHIGRQIYELRLAKGINRQELAKKISVTHQQCQKYEKGINRVAAGRLMLIAKVLGKPVKYFYEGLISMEDLKTEDDDQSLCAELSKNFMKIKSPVYQDAINNLIKILAKRGNDTKNLVENS